MSEIDKKKYIDGYGLEALTYSFLNFLENIGHGSNINADLLDGKHASHFSDITHSHDSVNGYQINVSTSAPPSGTDANVITFVK